MDGQVIPLFSDERKLKPDECFNIFWTAYPRKKNKKYARDAFKKALRIASWTEIIEALQAQVGAGMLKRNDRFTPHPSTWLNGEGWENDIETTEISESTANAARLVEKLIEREAYPGGDEPAKINGRISKI